jgi:hypothetical protein
MHTIREWAAAAAGLHGDTAAAAAAAAATAVTAALCQVWAGLVEGRVALVI